MDLYDFLEAKKFITISQFLTIFVPKKMEAKCWQSFDDFWRTHQTITDYLIEQIRMAVEEHNVEGEIFYVHLMDHVDEDNFPVQVVDVNRSYVRTANVVSWAVTQKHLQPRNPTEGEGNTTTGDTDIRADVTQVIRASIKATSLCLREEVDVTSEIYESEMKEFHLKNKIEKQIWVEIGHLRSTEGGRPRILEKAIKAAIHAGVLYADHEMIPSAALAVQIQKEIKGVKAFIVDKICKEIEKLQEHKR